MIPKISIIVPVYNVKPYLNKCLDSLIFQSMKEIEIIIIDDGSTDGSDAICDEYAKMDKRIIVCHQKNCGLSCARNVGLKIAKGKYIMFVDSDDYVEKDFCKIPYELAETKNVDLVMFHFRTIRNDIKINPEKKPIEDGYKTTEEALKTMFYVTSVGVWNKMYAKYLFNNCSFPDGHIFEDNAISYKLIINSKKTYFINTVLYNYCLRSNTLSHRDDYVSKCDCITMNYEMLHGLEVHGYKCRIYKGVFSLALRYLSFFGTKAKYSKECDELVMKFQDIYSISTKQKIILSIYKKSKNLFDVVCLLLGRRINRYARF